MTASRTLVIGLGNEYRRDDGVGLAVARRLREVAPPNVAVVEIESEGTALLEAWRGAESVLIVDAVMSGALPGTLHRLDARAGPFPVTPVHASTHAVSLVDAVELARSLGELPPTVLLFGIEAQDVDAGMGLSPPVERAAGRAVEALLREVGALSEPSRA